MVTFCLHEETCLQLRRTDGRRSEERDGVVEAKNRTITGNAKTTAFLTRRSVSWESKGCLPAENVFYY